MLMTKQTKTIASEAFFLLLKGPKEKRYLFVLYLHKQDMKSLFTVTNEQIKIANIDNSKIIGRVQRTE